MKKSTRDTSTLVRIYVLLLILLAGSVSCAVAEGIGLVDTLIETVHISMLPHKEIN